MHLSHFGMRLKNYITVKKKALAFPPIQKQPFPFPPYCGIGDLPGFALATQISLLQDVSLQHDHAITQNAHWTQELRQSYFGFWGACRLSTLFNKIMSGGCKGVSLLTRREMVFETPIYLPFDHLTWLVAQEYFNLVTMKAVNYISTLLLWLLKQHVGGSLIPQ